MESSIIFAWFRNIFWFLVLYGAYKMYRSYKSRPPKHPWSSNAYKWIWKDGKAIRRATIEEQLHQSACGRLTSFSIDNPNHFE